MRIRGKSGKSKVVVIAIAAALVVGVAAGVAVTAKRSQNAPVKLPTTLIEVGELVVNLADMGETRYVKVDPVLEVSGKVGEEALKDIKIRVRDSIIKVVSSKHFADLLKPDGKDKLKKEIITSTKEGLKENEPVKVYFNEFAMQ